MQGKVCASARPTIRNNGEQFEVRRNRGDLRVQARRRREKLEGEMDLGFMGEPWGAYKGGKATPATLSPSCRRGSL